MQSRDTRYWLRFESGDRRGDEVPLPEGVLVLGRRPSNEIEIADSSVSGKHAELRVEAGGVTLSDLGSTNGTKVAGSKVEEANLAHGDRIAIGHVQFTFHDGTLDDAAAGGSSDNGSANAQAGQKEEVGRISADRLAKVGRKGIWGVVFVVVVTAGAAAFFLNRGGGETARRQAPVVEVPGNLQADPSFEDLESPLAWENVDQAPVPFDRDRGFAQQGGQGLGAVLSEDEWAFARSAEFRLSGQGGCDVSVALAVEDSTRARLGVELTSSFDQGPTFVVWAPSLGETDGFEDVSLSTPPLPGYDRARVVLAAKGAGLVSADDVVVLSGSGGASAVKHGDFEAHVVGSSAVLVRPGHVAFCGIELGSWSERGLVGEGSGSWTIEPTEKGIALAAVGQPAGASDRVAHMLFHPRGAAASGAKDGAGSWISSLGPDGYRAHSSELERARTSALLLEKGIDLLRVGFEEPVKVSGRVAAGLLPLRVELSDNSRLDLQLDFQEERSAAIQLDQRAREAEKSGDFGAAISAWSELLDAYPFDATLVARADAGRARLVQQGLEEVGAVSREVERAGFFALGDLYRQCKESALDTARRYGGTEVETEARAVATRVDGELSALSQGTDHGDAARLRAVLEALDENQSPNLAEHLRGALRTDG